MGRSGGRAPAAEWSWWRWPEKHLVTGSSGSLDQALEASYAAFVAGEAYTDRITGPDESRLQHAEAAGVEGEEDGVLDALGAAWDEWLARHPDRRAEWDVAPRRGRLRDLDGRHAVHPRPFTSESVVANPDRYRRLYGILGMTDDLFETFLHIHRFAVAEQEARRLAREQEARAPRRERVSAAIYLEGYPAVPGRPVIPPETQERACRAYCKRMGYKVCRVYRASTPPEHDIPLRREIGVVPGQAFVYYRRESDHPYHAARNLLDARAIDVFVEFVESGPSRSLYGDDLPAESSKLPRVELASLWEVEPPTDDEREMHELITRIGRAETEEERSALMGQLRTLSQRMKAQSQATTADVPPAPADAEAPAEKPRVCYACQLRPAREGSAFCSDACAQAAAERLVQATTRGWCGRCGT